MSTDYDECDRLYFEELSFERVLDVYEHEGAAGVIVSVGGQIAQNVSLPLKAAGVRILGTDPDDIDRAEDRHKFSALLDSIGVDQPAWRELATADDALKFATEVRRLTRVGAPRRSRRVRLCVCVRVHACMRVRL